MRFEERRVGIEQPVEPIDQDADRQADRAACGRAGLRRAPAARAAPASPACSSIGSGVSGAAGGSIDGSAGASRHVRRRRRPAAPFSLSSRADNCRASSLKALFSTGVSTGDFGSPIGRNGRTFLGVSTGVSKSVGGEVSAPAAIPDRCGGGSGLASESRRPVRRPSAAASLASRSWTGESRGGSLAQIGLERCRPKVVCGDGGSLEQFEAAQRGKPRQAVEIAADAKAPIAGKIPRPVEDRQARQFDRQAARRHRPASSG